MGFLIRIYICIFFVGLFMYQYLDSLNALTELRLRIPSAAEELRLLEEENTQMEYEVERFESPVHLMSLSKKAPFSHLRHPLTENIWILEEGDLP